jgi:hypothetical protein
VVRGATSTRPPRRSWSRWTVLLNRPRVAVTTASARRRKAGFVRRRVGKATKGQTDGLRAPGSTSLPSLRRLAALGDLPLPDRSKRKPQTSRCGGLRRRRRPTPKSGRAASEAGGHGQAAGLDTAGTAHDSTSGAGSVSKGHHVVVGSVPWNASLVSARAATPRSRQVRLVRARLGTAIGPGQMAGTCTVGTVSTGRLYLEAWSTTAARGASGNVCDVP